MLMWVLVGSMISKPTLLGGLGLAFKSGTEGGREERAE